MTYNGFGFAMPCLRQRNVILTKNFIKMKETITDTFKHGIAKPMLVAVLLSLTSCADIFKQELYTINECKNFKKGDIIFTKEFYSVKRCTVLNNYPDKELIEVRDLQYDWDVSILSYDDFRFK